jgi:AraC-like DNA-binding protein
MAAPARLAEPSHEPSRGKARRFSRGPSDPISHSRGLDRREMVDRASRNGGVARVVDWHRRGFWHSRDRRRLAHCRSKRGFWCGVALGGKASLVSPPRRLAPLSWCTEGSNDGDDRGEVPSCCDRRAAVRRRRGLRAGDVAFEAPHRRSSGRQTKPSQPTGMRKRLAGVSIALAERSNQRMRLLLGDTPLESFVPRAPVLSQGQIKEIAARIGYSDVAHFSIAFKRHQAVSESPRRVNRAPAGPHRARSVQPVPAAVRVKALITRR